MDLLSSVKTACILRSTYSFCRRALRFMLITFLYHVILIILQSDWRCNIPAEHTKSVRDTPDVFSKNAKNK